MTVRLFAFFSCLLLLAQTACFEPKEGCLDIAATNFDASVDQDCCCQYPQLVLEVIQRFDSLSFTENTAYPAPLDSHLFRLKSVVFYLSDFQLVQNGLTYLVEDTVQLRAFAPTGADTITETLTDDFLLVRRLSFTNEVGSFRPDGAFQEVRIRLGLTEAAGRAIPRLAPVGHPLRTQPDSLWHGPGTGYIFAQIVLTRDTFGTTLPDTISFSRADLGDLFLTTTAPVTHQTGTNLKLNLLADYKSLFAGVDLTTGDKAVWKAQMAANLASTFRVYQ